MKIDLAQLVQGLRAQQGGKSLPLMLIVAVVMLAANLLAYFFYLPSLEADVEQTQNQLSSINSEASGLEQQIANLRRNIGLLPEMSAAYLNLKSGGDLDPEDRLKANDVLDELQKFYNATQYRLDMQPQTNYAFSGGGKRHSWVATPVTVHAEALYDRQLFGVTVGALRVLHGHSLLKSLTIERTINKPLTKEDFDKIRKDMNTGLVMGEVSFLWVTWPEEGKGRGRRP